MEQTIKQATRISEIDAATIYTDALPAEHPFYTDFTGLRGAFKENRLFRVLNIDPKDYTYNYEANFNNRALVFLAGMRGSGKTTELIHYVNELDNPDGYFCVFCSIDKELDKDHVEHMDILLYQLEKLIIKATERGAKLDDSILDNLQKWFEERIKEVNYSLKGEIGIEIGSKVESKIPFLLSLFAGLRMGVTGSRERADKVRMVFRNRFSDFARQFNTFVLQAGEELRRRGISREILFIIDGLEKTNSAITRKKIILDDANRIKNIQANMLLLCPWN